MRLVLLLLFVLVAACGGSPTEAACRDFIAYYEGLECTGSLDPGVDCAAYRDYPCDASEYFTCLEDQFFCDENGDYVDNGFQACASAANC